MAVTIQWWLAHQRKDSDHPDLDQYRGLGELEEKGITANGSVSDDDGFCIFEVCKLVEDAYNAEVLWEDGDGGLDDYDYLWIESDQDVLLELQNTAGPVRETIKIKANMPWLTTSNEVMNSAIVDETLSTLSTVDKITAQRNVPDGAGDATVRLILYKARS